jgi:uncharacterized protein
MEFAIISDIHDRVDRLNQCLNILTERGIETILFCGDFCSPFVIKVLGESGKTIHAVFGNNDGDRFHILNQAQNYPNIRLYGEYIGDLENILTLDGVKIGVTHYPFYAQTMVKTGWYDAVFFGHTHKQHKQKYGKALLMNPGEIAGVLNNPSFAIYDTVYQTSEFIELE